MDYGSKLSTVRIPPRASRWRSPGVPFLIVRVSAVFIVLLALVANATAQEDGRGIQLAISDDSGRVIGGYRQSYALLIGVSDYTAGWPDLESVPSELAQVENVLIAHGFKVVKRLNPDARALEDEFEAFIRKYGYLEETRLLFYFSGHGHTRKGGRKGYLVPSDAPLPSRDEQAFLQKALPMSQILAWARSMEAKHVLFMFDSCFSGTVFKQRSIPDQPSHITRATALAVRQFITAGSAGEQVPAQSIFTPAFVDALKYGWGDLNGDGYVSGVELGLYLQAKVPEHAQQTPQFGKIRDYELSRGDFVFRLRESWPGLLVGHLKIMVNAADAKVYVGGEQVGVAQPQQPLRINDLSAGEHWLRVEAAGYYPWVTQEGELNESPSPGLDRAVWRRSTAHRAPCVHQSGLGARCGAAL